MLIFLITQSKLGHRQESWRKEKTKDYTPKVAKKSSAAAGGVLDVGRLFTEFVADEGRSSDEVEVEEAEDGSDAVEETRDERPLAAVGFLPDAAGDSDGGAALRTDVLCGRERERERGNQYGGER